jgi:carboxylesterase
VNFSQFFQDPEHQSFNWPGGRPAALLVHGFPGTAAELRPLAGVLHGAGWTVQGLLLPGFGPEIDSLPERRHTEWLAAVRQALAGLKTKHQPVVVVGFSMGAGLALAAAAEEHPDGMVLMAPFWKLRGALWGILPIIGRVFPKIQPFRLFKLDLSNPEARRGMENFLPGLDLDDADVQQAIRNLTIPVSIVDQVRRVGLAAQKAAPTAQGPALVLQGLRDEVVSPSLTGELVASLPGPVLYRKVNGSHDLLDAQGSAWSEVVQATLDFAASLQERQTE